MSSKRISIFLTALLLSTLVLTTGCWGSQVTPTVAGSTANAGQAKSTFTALPAATLPVPTPTATQEPLALRINNEGISIAEYQAELSQLQEALQTLGKTKTLEVQRQQVLDNLTETLLLAQGGVEAGFKVDEAGLQAEVDRLSQQLGGTEALKAWMTARGYTDTTFHQALRRQLAAAWQRDQITAAVPTEAEQLHARQILTTDETIANQALQQVKIPGANFAAYAYRYDTVTGGDLGWFPRGYLTLPEVEQAAFALQPGEISPVITSAIGYHIVQVISREPSRAISPDARRVLQHKALQDWLKTRKEGSKVEILLP